MGKGVKRANHSCLARSDVKNKWSYTSTLPYDFIAYKATISTASYIFPDHLIKRFSLILRKPKVHQLVHKIRKSNHILSQIKDNPRLCTLLFRIRFNIILSLLVCYNLKKKSQHLFSVTRLGIQNAGRQ